MNPRCPLAITFGFQNAPSEGCRTSKRIMLELFEDKRRGRLCYGRHIAGTAS
jgi:hypothetical protein